MSEITSTAYEVAALTDSVDRLVDVLRALLVVEMCKGTVSEGSWSPWHVGIRMAAELGETLRQHDSGGVK